MRKRRYTESFGLLLSKDEREAMRRFLRERRLTATEYLREAAIVPVMQLEQAEGEGQDDPEAV
jgi:alpha-D-ribose 1-methylphosphonate 5-triphosphate synthase subunit PhnI